MENYNNGGLFPVLVDSQKVVQEEKPQNPFILGNTVEVDINRLQEDYLVPVFSRDNVESISHLDFLNSVFDAAQRSAIQQPYNSLLSRTKSQDPFRCWQTRVKPGT